MDNRGEGVRGPEAQRMGAFEALRAAGPKAVLSHEVAAAAVGIELVDDQPRRLTVPANRSRLVVPGWRVHRFDLHPADVASVEGLRTTAPLRTVLDLVRSLEVGPAVVAADSALRNGLVSHEELALRLGGAQGAGATHLRQVGRLVDPLSGSVLETLLRILLWSGALPLPCPQYVVADEDGGFVARVDFCWPAARLIVEADGFAYHSDRSAYRRDRQRLNFLERLGWRVLRFSWEDVVSRQAYVLSTVADCLAGTP